jgi:hypothetical protein
MKLSNEIFLVKKKILKNSKNNYFITALIKIQIYIILIIF